MGWEDTANAYQQMVQQGVQYQNQANQQMAKQPLELYDRFQQAYMQKMQMERQKQMDQRQAEQDAYARQHQLAQEKVAEQRYQSGVLRDAGKEIDAGYTGDPADKARIEEWLRQSGISEDKIYNMIPKGKQMPGTLPTSIGKEEGQDIMMPGIPSKEGEIVPRSDWGATIARLTSKDESDVAAKRASEERMLSALESKTSKEEKAAKLAEDKLAESTRLNDWKMKHGDEMLGAVIRGQNMANARSGAIKIKDVPTNILNSIMKNDAGLNNIDAAIAAITADPGALSLMNKAPDILTQRFRKGHENTLAALTNVAAVRLHDLSGAAVTDPEWARLSRSIPQSTDLPEVALEKLRALKAEYKKMNDSLFTTFSPERGYDRPPTLKPPGDSPAAPNPTAIPKAGEMKEGTISKSGKFKWSNGKWVANA